MADNAVLWRIKPLAPLLGAAALGLTLSISAWFYVSQSDEQRALQDFYQDVGENTQVLKYGLTEYNNKLVAIGTLFSASQHDLTRQEFVAFSSTLYKDQPAILGLTWVPRVMREQRVAHERDARQDGIADYHIRDRAADNSLVVAPERDEYLPIYYSTKETTSSKLYGYDLRDGGLRQQTFEIARDENRIVASREFELRSGQGDRRGFIVALPIYLRGHPIETVEQRRLNVEGYVLGVFQIGQMIDTILANVTQPADIYLYEYDAGPNDMAVLMKPAHAKASPLAPVRLGDLVAAPHWAGEVSTSGKHWKLVAPVPEQLIARSHDRALFILAVSLLVVCLVVAFIWQVLRNARQLARLARTDPLTGLANRVVLTERLTAAFAASRAGALPFSLHFIDLDGFKEINDSLGHSAGDLLLQAAVQRFASVIRRGDLLVRFGGDEFAVLQMESPDPGYAQELAEAIIEAMAAPFTIEDNEVTVTASIGIAPYSAETAAPDAMMLQADLALYRAKDDGRNCFRFHSGELDRTMSSRAAIADELRVAISRGELELYYQPQVGIASGQIIGVEALVRWNSPTRGLVMPSVFIPIAEQSGIINRLGAWVFEAACAQMRQWLDDGIAPRTMAVNVSGIQIKRLDELSRDIAGKLAKWRLAPETIELELTETILMDASQKHSEALHRLRQMGLRIAIDDFGTGYSSLNYLTVFPVNRLKIAQELVFHVCDETRSATVVKAAIRLAHELDIDVVAEGVETADQALFLLAAGCENAQGYHYSRPVTAAQAAVLLRRGRIAPAASDSVPAKKRTAA